MRIKFIVGKGLCCMGWKDKAKEWGAGDFTFLTNDGECLTFVVVDDPILLKSKYKGKEQNRVGCPVVTDDGFLLFVTGMRVFRKLSKFESRFKTDAFMVIRHGVEGDINAKYDVTVYDNAEKTKLLFAKAKKEYKPDMTAEAAEAVQKVMDN